MRNMKKLGKFTLMALAVTGVIVVAVAVKNRVEEAKDEEC